MQWENCFPRITAQNLLLLIISLINLLINLWLAYSTFVFPTAADGNSVCGGRYGEECKWKMREGIKVGLFHASGCRGTVCECIEAGAWLVCAGEIVKDKGGRGRGR